MSRKLGLLETFAWACQRGTQDILALGVLERLYALCDVWTQPAARRRTIAALEGYHAGLGATESAGLDPKTLARFRLAADIAHQALLLLEPQTGSGQKRAIGDAERFCLDRLNVRADLVAGKASVL